MVNFSPEAAGVWSPAACRSSLAASMRCRGETTLDEHVVHPAAWRSLKHEDIYLKGYADGREAHAGIAAASGAGEPHADSCLARRHRRWIHRHGSGHELRLD